MVLKVLTIYGVLGIVGLLLAPLIAAWKNRDGSRWAFLCFLFPPALLVLLASSRLKERPTRTTSWDEHDDLDEARKNLQ